jgi:hypothetical protein
MDIQEGITSQEAMALLLVLMMVLGATVPDLGAKMLLDLTTIRISSLVTTIAPGLVDIMQRDLMVLARMRQIIMYRLAKDPWEQVMVVTKAMVNL